jgi:transketolase
MHKETALRDAYGEALAKLGETNRKVVVLDSDAGSSCKSILFGKKFPDRYYNVGISEINMNAMAAGFAASGFIAFTNTFAAFMTLRGGDPINSLICYDNLNVKLAGTYCGLSDSYDGASHHATFDMAVLRALPNITILSPCDAVETQKAVFAAAAHSGPVYLRVSRAPEPLIFDDSYDFRIGKGVVLRPGTDVALAATGSMVHEALKAADLLAGEGISARVVNIHTIKPIDKELITCCARETGALVAAEEHSIYGGLGSAVSEILSGEFPVPMEFAGMTDYAESGDYRELQKKYGLDAESIACHAKKAIAKKRKTISAVST